MSEPEHLDEIVDHLVRSSRLGPGEARRVVEDVLAYLSESAPEFIARRHAELRRAGVANPEIYRRLEREVAERRFASPPLTQRQIRRLIYG